MIKFIKKTVIYIILCLVILTCILYKYSGYVDIFYDKFTTPNESSMIIGDSRAMQGVRPSILNKILETNTNNSYSLPVLNYAFTINQAFVGPLYRKSILKKLDKTTSSGVFLISITPMMLSSDIDNDNTKDEFTEKDAPPHNMLFVNNNPNYEHFFRNIKYFNIKNIIKKEYMTHKDGWLEMKNISTNKNALKNIKYSELEGYADMMANLRKKSLYRLKSLDTLVGSLKKYGDVFLFRMPLDKEFRDLENNYQPNFNFQMDSISKKNNIHYINFGLTDSVCKTFDGHHLDIESSKIFSKRLSDSILKYKRHK